MPHTVKSIVLFQDLLQLGIQMVRPTWAGDVPHTVNSITLCNFWLEIHMVRP